MNARARHPRSLSAGFRQSGVALVVALIFLVILTLLGIAALANNTLQTRMTYGVSEANLAFQSAETALSAGENWLYSQTARPSAGCATSAGSNPVVYTPVDSCGQTAATASAIWPRPNDSVSTPPVGRSQYFDESWWTSNGRKYGYTYKDNTTPAADGSQPIGSGTTYDTPRYVIEELGADTSGSLVVGQGRTYRIYNYQLTARAYGSQQATRSVVQSVFGQGY